MTSHRASANVSITPGEPSLKPSAPLNPSTDGGVAKTRVDVLDGWRAISILGVLAGHWVPLGPHRWALNTAAATTGMALFFTLSGFLIVRVLLDDPRAGLFLVRRGFRIIPLAWVAMLTLFAAGGGNVAALAANLMFIANLPPHHLMRGGEHLWSLCVEVQFYLAIAIIVAIGGRRALFVLPFAALAVTLARIISEQPISIVTWHRVDEILAGGSLALLVYRTRVVSHMVRAPAWTPVVLFVCLFVAGLPYAGPIAYGRPYLAAATIGASIFAMPVPVRRLLCSSPARYIAQISFAVYVFHGMLSATWLGSGDGLVRYAKRPLLAMATVTLAHWSTFRFETPLIGVGKRLSRRFERS